MRRSRHAAPALVALTASRARGAGAGALVMAAALAAGCGQKGPLTLPPPAAKAPASADPADEAGRKKDGAGTPAAAPAR